MNKVSSSSNSGRAEEKIQHTTWFAKISIKGLPACCRDHQRRDARALNILWMHMSRWCGRAYYTLSARISTAITAKKFSGKIFHYPPCLCGRPAADSLFTSYLQRTFEYSYSLLDALVKAFVWKFHPEFHDRRIGSRFSNQMNPFIRVGGGKIRESLFSPALWISFRCTREKKIGKMLKQKECIIK